MKAIGTTLSISLIIVAFVTGTAFGYFISPSYQQTMYTKEDMGLGQADRFVDLRYINQMAKHHRAAMLLAEQTLGKTKRGEVAALAKEILANEPKLIAELYGWKKDWYRDGRSQSDPMVPNLGPSDEKFDLRFLNALIAHHEEGINMTNEVRAKSSRKEILDNADAVETFLNNSLTTLKSWREKWYRVN